MIFYNNCMSKINTKEKAVALLFILIIFAVLIGILFHPVEIGVEFRDTYRSTALLDMSFIERLETAINALETSVNAGVPARSGFIELYGLSQLAMNKNVIIDPNYGALYKTPYGQIAYAVEEKYLDTHLDQVYGLVNSLVSAKIPFLYVQAPFKLPDANSQLPLNVTDYSNSNADLFLEKLTFANVDCFDLRPPLRNSGKTQSELFFNTDHHWTIETAFLSAGLIAEKLNNDYGFQIDASHFDINNYNVETYKDFFLGSMGRRVGRLFCGVDDFTLITPKFETDLTFTENGAVFQRGAFADTVLMKEFIDTKAPVDTNRYAVYRRDQAEVIFINHLVDGGKILIIKDSFGTPVYSFLALGVHEVRALDVRLFREDVAEYAARHRPDIVILMYNADCFTEQMFDFGS